MSSGYFNSNEAAQRAAQLLRDKIQDKSVRIDALPRYDKDEPDHWSKSEFFVCLEYNSGEKDTYYTSFGSEKEIASFIDVCMIVAHNINEIGIGER